MTNNNYHNDARALLIKAAENSGFLKEIARLLWFVEKHNLDACCNGPLSCAPCELVEELTFILDDHCCLPNIVAENCYGDGLDISPRGDEAAEFEAFFAEQAREGTPA